MVDLTKNICEPCNFLNKSTLLIDSKPEFLLENIYKPIEWFIENLYVISNNPAFLKVTDRLLSVDQFEEIHHDIRKKLLLNPRDNCCVIVELDDLNFTNKYMVDMLLNRENNITLICYSLFPIHISQYFGSFSKIFVKKTSEDHLLKLYFAQHFRDTFDQYSDFMAWLESVPDGYLIKIGGKNPDFVENKVITDENYTIKKCPVQQKREEIPEVKELTNKVLDLLSELDILTKKIKQLEII